MLLNRTRVNFWGERLQYFTSTLGTARPFKSFKRLRRSGRLMSWWAAPWTNKKVARIRPWGTLAPLKKTTQASRNHWIIPNSCKGKWFRWTITRRKLFRRTQVWTACDTKIRILCTRTETPKAISTRITFSWAMHRVATWQKAWSLTLVSIQMIWVQMLTRTLSKAAQSVCRKASYCRCRSIRPLNFTSYPKRLRIASKGRWERCSASKPKSGASPSVKWRCSPAKWTATQGRSTSVPMSLFITLQTSIACQ